MAKPTIVQIGTVRVNGRTVSISNWGLGTCSSACKCHRGPDGRMAIAEDNKTGSLGLVSFTDAGCGCCDPWTVSELSQLLRNFVAQAEVLGR